MMMHFCPIIRFSAIINILLLHSIICAGAFVVPFGINDTNQKQDVCGTFKSAGVDKKKGFFVFITRRRNNIEPLLREQQSTLFPKSRLYVADVESNNEEKKNENPDIIPNNVVVFSNFFESVWTRIERLAKSTLTNTVNNEREFGSRGEAIVMMQFVLSVFILLGKVPLLQDLINFLFGPVLFLGGIFLSGQAIRELNTTSFTALTQPVQIEKGGKLITSGVYSYMRHPVYTGNILSLIGLSIMTHSSMRFLLTIFYYILVDWKSREEERNMVKEFGYNTYESYRQRVRGKFFPHWDVVSEKISKSTTRL